MYICPNCRDNKIENISGFNLEYYGYNIVDLQRSKQTDLDFIYQCNNCRSEWKLNKDKTFLTKFDNTIYETDKNWINKPQLIPDHFSKVLMDIKFNRGYILSKFKDNYMIPCSSTDYNNHRNEYTVLVLTDRKPSDFRNCKLIDDIKSIQTSQFAINKYIRDKIMNAPDYEMSGLAPVILVDKELKEYWVSESLFITNHNGISDLAFDRYGLPNEFENNRLICDREILYILANKTDLNIKKISGSA